MLRLTDIDFQDEYTLWFKVQTAIPEEFVPKTRGTILNLLYINEPGAFGSHLLELRTQDRQFTTRLMLRKEQENAQNFLFILRRSVTCVSLFNSLSPDRTEIELRIIIIYDSFVNGSKYQWGISNKAMAKFKELFGGKTEEGEVKVISDTDVFKRLANDLSFKINGKNCYLVEKGKAKSKAGENLPDEIFSIIGNTYRLCVSISRLGTNTFYVIDRSIPFRNGNPKIRIPSIVEGDLSFSREKVLKNSLEDDELRKKYLEADSYFRTWDTYAEKMLLLWVNEAKEAGYYSVQSVEEINKFEQRFIITLNKQLNSNFWKKAVEDKIITLTEGKPPAFFSSEGEPEIDGITYFKSLLVEKQNKSDEVTPVSSDENSPNDTYSSDTDDFDEDIDSNSVQKDDIEVNPEVSESHEENGTTHFTFDGFFKKRFLTFEGASLIIVQINPDGMSLEVKAEARIPQVGDCISLSLVGQFTNINRSFRARERIAMHESANPQLASLIEGTRIVESSKTQKHNTKTLSDYVKDKVYPTHAPTKRQQEAIELALNTPDILLIQGPPGTGKTTVITAIIEQLNQYHNHTKTNFANVLVSASQHAAVENLAARLSVNDLPGYKIGRKKKNNDVAIQIDQNEFEKWTEERLILLEQHYPEFASFTGQESLENLFLKYQSMPSGRHALELLQKLEDTIQTQGLSQFQDKIDFLRHRYLIAGKNNDNVEMNGIIPAIRALRTNENSFLDDGVKNALICLQPPVSSFLEEDEKKILEDACSWCTGDSMIFLPKIEELKEALLTKFRPMPEDVDNNIDDELFSLYADCVEALKQQSLLGTDNTENDPLSQLHKNMQIGEKDILAQYYYELKNNPYKVCDDLEAYTYAFAATVQQADSNPMRAAKKIEKWQNVIFDTVIVDEAARTYPPDLLIPMSQAKERIILVGDHKQLPHIIEEKVLAHWDEDEDLQDLDVSTLSHSMFQYLFEKLSGNTGVQRTIMLDEQFRMHPLLGNFVSEWFYELDGGQGFKSPLPPEYFTHTLADVKITNLPFIKDLPKRAAAWFDVGGPADKRSTNGSRGRQHEAESVARKLQAWMDSPGGKELTFGVITFYREQCELINQALTSLKVMRKVHQGEEYDSDYIPTDEYRWVEKRLSNGKVNREERLQVGTVDAFQGKEFDVVLLSVVRSAGEDVDDNLLISRGEKVLKSHKCDNMDVTDDILLQKGALNIYGRICTNNSENAARNLLCVALSRQKKLLTVFGDKRMFNCSPAIEFSPELHAMLTICEQEENGKYEHL